MARHFLRRHEVIQTQPCVIAKISAATKSRVKMASSSSSSSSSSFSFFVAAATAAAAAAASSEAARQNIDTKTQSPKDMLRESLGKQQ